MCRYSRPRPETTVDILTRVLEICPEIAPPEIRAERTPTIEDIRPIIVEENCGFRPCRKGGPRLELEWKETGARKVPVIHNYGYVPFLIPLFEIRGLTHSVQTWRIWLHRMLWLGLRCI